MESLNSIEMGLSGLASKLVYNASSMELLRSSRARADFQWGGTISAIVTWAGDSFYGTCSFQQYEFWIFLFHFASCCLFLIFVDPDTSGEAISLADYTFGIVSVCKFPSRPVQSFKQIYTFLKPFQLLIPTVSHFPLFVLTPDRLAHGLRDSIASGIFCLVLAVFLLVIELRDIGGQFGEEKKKGYFPRGRVVPNLLNFSLSLTWALQ
ncbi:conserved hypothetical protein [Ricinus communis]|uniref:Uncharacterized protein n=1 Tax=Ricinus communis TaxID=3988 RepID=B9T4V8_RICCO|nr:conserved hypothetical protein [Ricinus communis]